MDRGAWWATDHGIAELDMTEWLTHTTSTFLKIILFNICSSVAKSCPPLCNPVDCSTPSFPVLHYLLEFAQVLFNKCQKWIFIVEISGQSQWMLEIVLINRNCDFQDRWTSWNILEVLHSSMNKLYRAEPLEMLCGKEGFQWVDAKRVIESWLWNIVHRPPANLPCKVMTAESKRTKTWHFIRLPEQVLYVTVSAC